MTLKHFSFDEFECPCCGRNEMDPEFLLKLDAAREWAGVAFRINSAFRCPERNAAVGGEPKSRHLTGQAVDIAFTDRGMLGRIVASFYRAGLISMAISKPKNFIHVDSFPQHWMGLY